MTQPSGWYDDPQDPSQLRYFDGILWSDHTVPKQAAPRHEAATPSPYAAPPTSPGGYAVPSSGSAYGQPPAQPGGYQPAPGMGYGSAPAYQWRPAGPVTSDGRPLAEWWQRLLAYLIDNVLLGMIVSVVGFKWFGEFVTWYVDLIRSTAATGATPDQAAITQQVTAMTMPLTIITVIVSVIYQTVFLMRSGATPGKMALGIRVRRVDRPGPLTLVEALRRQVIYVGATVLGLVPIVSLLTSLLHLLDSLWLLWDPRRQCLHDKIADTVVEKSRY